MHKNSFAEGDKDMAIKCCPKCNEDNSATASVCIHCGTSLRDCEVIGNTGERNYAYFGREEENDVCPNCVKRLSDENEQVTGRRLLRLSVILLVLFVVAGLIMLLKAYK